MGKEGMEYMEQNESQSSQNISCYIEINWKYKKFEFKVSFLKIIDF
jgi:hypothetical protein